MLRQKLGCTTGGWGGGFGRRHTAIAPAATSADWAIKSGTFVMFGWSEGRDASASFDTLGYLAANPDVAAAGVNPLDHYLISGIYEGRTVVNDGLWG